MFSFVAQDRFAAKHKYIFREIAGLSRVNSQDNLYMRILICVQQNLFQILCIQSNPLIENPHLSPVVMAMGDRSSIFPPNSIVIFNANLLEV